MASIKKVTNGNCYLNGNNLLGKVEEATLMEVTPVMTEFSALGMIGKVEYPAGFEAMEITLKLHAYHADLLKQVGDTHTKHRLQIRAAIDEHTSSGTVSRPCVIYATVSTKKLPMGGFKAHERVTQDVVFTVFYVKMEIDGENILEYDAEASIYKVDGIDKLATYRNNLGI